MAVPGCIVPDYCIHFHTPGVDWCRALDGAVMWPNGHPEQAVMVTNEQGGPPEGCLCFNDAEQATLTDQTPAEQYEYLIALIDIAARDECSSLVPVGYDDNCYVESGPDASMSLLPVSGEKSFECIGHCDYINPPPHGECPDKNPYECNDDEYGTDEVEGDSDTESDTSSETGIINGPGAFITCGATTCIVDADRARMLWDDPSLLADDAVLVFDSVQSRFVVMAASPDTVAHALGLRPGDVIESIDGVVIDDLDAATQAYLEHEHAQTLELRVGRGPRWIDFELQFE